MKTPLNCMRLALATGLLFSVPILKGAEADPDAPLQMKEVKAKGTPPKLIKPVEPLFPYAMYRAGLIGSVTLEFIIDRDGTVKNPRVLRSNNPWFERPAVDAVLQWKFQPGTINGRAVKVRASQSIEFNSDRDGADVPDIWRVTKSKDHGKLPPEFQWETPPKPTSTMLPVYPFELLKGDTAGKASVSYVVGPNGRVVKALVREASTPEFGAAVLAMVEAWRFEPAKNKEGKACYARLGGEYEFRPNGRGDVPVDESAREILRTLEKRPERIVGSSELDLALKPLSRRSPVHPTALQKTSPEGQALIEFFVDEHGDAQLPRVVSNSAPEFGYAAVQAVATWRFSVPLKNGKPVVARVRVPVEFKPKAPKAKKT